MSTDDERAKSPSDTKTVPDYTLTTTVKPNETYKSMTVFKILSDIIFELAKKK